MSYIQRRRRHLRRRALSGIQSQPTGAAVSVLALRGGVGDIIEYGHIGPKPIQGQVAPPRWYAQMQGVSLSGDDVPTASSLATPTLEDPFQSQVASRLATLQQLEDERNRDDRMRGYLQLAATLSIPLAAAVWKWLLGRRAARSSTE